MRVRDVKTLPACLTYQADNLVKVGDRRDPIQDRYNIFYRFCDVLALSESAEGSRLLKNARSGVDGVAIPKPFGEWMFGQCHTRPPCIFLYGSLKSHLNLRRLGLKTHIISCGKMRARREELIMKSLVPRTTVTEISRTLKSDGARRLGRSTSISGLFVAVQCVQIRTGATQSFRFASTWRPRLQQGSYITMAE